MRVSCVVKEKRRRSFLMTVSTSESMKTVVLDSFALLAYFEKEPGWKRVIALLTGAAAEEHLLACTTVNWGEVLYITERVYGREKADAVSNVLDELPISWVDVDRRLAREAANFKVGGGLAYADCFAAALAYMRDGPVVTGDPEFARVEDTVTVEWLGREER